MCARYKTCVCACVCTVSTQPPAQVHHHRFLFHSLLHSAKKFSTHSLSCIVFSFSKYWQRCFYTNHYEKSTMLFFPHRYTLYPFCHLPFLWWFFLSIYIYMLPTTLIQYYVVKTQAFLGTYVTAHTQFANVFRRKKKSTKTYEGGAALKVTTWRAGWEATYVFGFTFAKHAKQVIH